MNLSYVSNSSTAETCQHQTIRDIFESKKQKTKNFKDDSGIEYLSGNTS